MGEGAKFRDLLNALLREPLAHFMVAGLLVFLISAWRGETGDPANRTITINAEQVARLGAEWEQNWRRAPTPGEIDGLIRDNIKDEIYYREAQRMGLDEDDAVIRRRLRSKMEYLAGAQVESTTVTDATLEAWLQKYPARFAPEAAFSFDQIYLGDDAGANSGAILKRLTEGEDWAQQGNAISLPKSLENAERADVLRLFGPEFTDSLADLAAGRWSGPVASGFGSHLVRLRAIDTPPKPQLARVRQAVENDWRAATYEARKAAAYQALLDGYTIRIDKP